QQREHAGPANSDVVVVDSRHALDTRLRGYQLVLLGMQGLLQAKPDLDRASFERYIAELAPERNASQARSFSYAKRVAAADRERFVAATRADRSLQRFSLRPAGQRPEYVVIYYVAPFTPNERAMGLDLTADPVRRLSVERTRDTGVIVASGPVTLALTDERGVSLRLAVYRRTRAIDSLDARRELFDGIVSVTFGARDAIGDIVARHVGEKLRLRVADGGEVFYDSASWPIEADA